MSTPFEQVMVSEEFAETDLSLLETLDHVLNLMVSSVETAREVLRRRGIE